MNASTHPLVPPPPEPATVRPKDLVEAVGISNSYASMLLNGTRVPPPPLALRIWQATGCKLGALERLTDAECEQFARLSGAAREAAKPVVAMGEGFAG